ncbi:MAG: DUF2059 domain-containing protein [Sphingobacteriaceae bacterium]|nr:MAG: DUF2059 domain-containing protein [Sphingobacteriaceae bacterium]
MKPFYTRFSFALAAFCLLINLNLKAQETPLTPSHIKAAEDMLTSMNMPYIFTSSINNMVNMQTANVPLDQRKAFSDAMKTFLNKYLNWDLLKTDLSKIYASEFTEPEIKELTKFYQTPLGKKMIEKSPALMQKGMLIGQQAVVSHQSELQDIMKSLAPKN